jgi:hypothetical protein
LKILQAEAEKQLKRRIIMDYFKDSYQPIDVTDPTYVDKYLRDVLKATGALIQGEGDIMHVELELQRKWREERETG